jgi:hypothetical protein
MAEGSVMSMNALERVQRDTMVGPTTRAYMSIAETVTVSAAYELTVAGMTEEGKRLIYTLRLDGSRHRVMQWSEDGVKSVVDGVWLERKYQMPWLSKCG